MKINFGGTNTFQGITDDINEMAEVIGSHKIKLMKDCGKVIKANLIKQLPKSKQKDNATNYDGTPYTHMQDDIKVAVKDEDGNVSLVVHGGKKTGYKWHMVDDGTSTTQATHFTKKTQDASADELDALLTNLLVKVTMERNK